MEIKVEITNTTSTNIMSQDWEEIRRLAADLQRAQLSGSIQKLSERNCIEIVSRLLKLDLLEVIYTSDGKEYLTPQQLQRFVYTHASSTSTLI